MNLVQIQERLKEAPTQAIMQYANGMNPMVPPYLALAELKRRESINQSAQAQQSMQQGQRPSVKEQIEQTAGISALQQPQGGGLDALMQARQMGEQEMRGGGLATLPVGDMFNFADGGIVAFAKGDFVEEEGGLKSIKQLNDEYWKALKEDDFQSAKRLKQAIEERKTAAPRTVNVPVAGYGGAELEEVTPRAPRAPMEQEVPVPAQRREGPIPAPGGISGQISMPERRQGAMPMGIPSGITETSSAQASTRTPSGLAALPGATEAEKRILDLMRTEPSLEKKAEEYNKALGLFGLSQPYGEERMKRAQAMEAARQKDLEERGIERLMTVLAGMSGRGLAGAGPAYLKAVAAERASDAAFRKQMDEMLGGVEEKRRSEASTRMTESQRRMEEDRKLGIGAAEEIYKAQRRREDEMAKIKLENQLRLMQPNEAMIFMNVMNDIRRRNPNMSEAEIYSKAIEAKQGITPELKREQLQAKAYNEAAKMWEDMIRKPKDITREQWIKQEASNRLRSQTDKSLPGDIDALLKKYGSK